MKFFKYTTIVWILFYVLIFSFLINNSYKNLDPDLGWHIEVGGQILAEKNVPDQEYYNYTLAGEKWADHEWLMNLIIYLIYENFGYLSLSVFFALLAILTLILLNIYTQKYFTGAKKNIVLIMIFQFFGILAMSPHLGIRVQEITLFNLLLLLIIINSYETANSYKKLFWLVPLFCFWANLHAGFLVGVFILFMWLGVKIAILIINKIKLLQIFDLTNKQTTKEIFIFFLFTLLAVAVTLINPYGIKLYSFLSGYTNDYYLKVINEWLPVYYLPIQYKQIIYSAIITAMLILLFIDYYNAYKKKKAVKINLWHLGLILVFMYLAFKSKRHFPLFFIVSFPWLIAALGRNLFFPDNIKKLFFFGRIIKTYIVLALLLVSAKYLIFTEFTANPFNSPYFCSFYPCKAVAFIKNDSKIKNNKIFNNYDWGGFMIHVWPEKKLFIDGRLPFYEFAGHTLLEEYHEFFKEEKVEQKLDQYEIKLVLLKKYGKIKLDGFEKFFLGFDEEKINKRKKDMRNFLSNSPEWNLVYDDRISAVYSRK